MQHTSGARRGNTHGYDARMRACFLGIDVGTSSTKCVVLAEDGAVLATGEGAYPASTPRPGWSEQDPALWWEGAQTAVKSALRAADAPAQAIRAIGLTGQMHGLVLLDARGRTLRPCILWNDQRSAPQCERLHQDPGLPALVAATGNRALPGFTAPKILWVQEFEPDIWASTALVLLPKDWLRWRLSGTAASDLSDAAGMLLMDGARRAWSSAMLDRCGLRPGQLPTLHEGPEPCATLRADAAEALGLPAGIPIVAGAGDQAAGAIGTGVISEGCVSAVLGTSGVVFAATSRWSPTPDGSLHAFCHAVPRTWHLMGVMLSAGGSVRWFRDAMGASFVAEARAAGEDPYERMTRAASRVPPGADGLLFLPYLSGERCPHPDPDARGAFAGLSASHGPAHLARAVFEGVTLGMRECLQLVRDRGVRVDQVRISGGGARSAWWRQLCADLFGAPVVTTTTADAAALGAAMLAGVGAGRWPDVQQAVGACVRTGDALLPGPDAPALAALPARYARLYEQLRPLCGPGAGAAAPR